MNLGCRRYVPVETNNYTVETYTLNLVKGPTRAGFQTMYPLPISTFMSWSRTLAVGEDTKIQSLVLLSINFEVYLI